MDPMTPLQREFFAKLQAPIPGEDLKHRTQGGTKLTYITSRTLYNRLDEVAGPANWYTEYERTDRGVVCKLWINVPDDDPELHGRRWMFKADGGGFAGMSEKDNDEKSGFSDGAKRAGAAWGIARELYGNGMPDYIEDAAPPRGNSAPPARNSAPPAQSGPPQRQGPPSRQGPPQSNGGNGNGGQGNYDNFKPPAKPGGSTFAWAKKQEETFGQGVVKEMDNIVAEFGYPKNFKDFNAEQQMYVCWAAIDTIKTWPSYKGEYDHLEDPRPARDPR